MWFEFQQEFKLDNAYISHFRNFDIFIYIYYTLYVVDKLCFDMCSLSYGDSYVSFIRPFNAYLVFNVLG